MLKNIFLLIGCGENSVPPVIDPDPREPYHVVFNYQVAAADIATYKSSSDLINFTSRIRSLKPYTHHEPQTEYPYIHFMDNAILPGFGASTPYQTAFVNMEKLRVPDINKIAHPDRRGKLPKSFQMRFGNTGAGFFPSMHIFKYNLDKQGKDYVSLRSHTDHGTDTVSLFLSYQIGANSDISEMHDLGVSLRGAESNDVKFVIRDTKLELYVNSPGNLVAALDLPSPLQIRENVDLAIFKPINGLEPGVETLAFSDLLISDANL